jgi:hypothetical protein
MIDYDKLHQRIKCKLRLHHNWENLGLMGKRCKTCNLNKMFSIRNTGFMGKTEIYEDKYYD